MIVWIASFPRSGNTLTRVLLHHLCGVTTQSVYPEGRNKLSNLTGQVGNLKAADIQTLHHEDDGTYFIKTHEYPGPSSIRAPEAKTLYIVRDGRDVAVSRAHYALLEGGLPKRAFEQAMKNSCKGIWQQHVNSWSNYEPKAVLKFEDLITDPIKSIRTAFERLELDIEVTDQEVPSFEDLKKIRPKFFRRGKAGSWKDEMSPEIQDLFWENNGWAMEYLEYER